MSIYRLLHVDIRRTTEYGRWQTCVFGVHIFSAFPDYDGLLTSNLRPIIEQLVSEKLEHLLISAVFFMLSMWDYYKQLRTSDRHLATTSGRSLRRFPVRRK